MAKIEVKEVVSAPSVVQSIKSAPVKAIPNEAVVEDSNKEVGEISLSEIKRNEVKIIENLKSAKHKRFYKEGILTKFEENTLYIEFLSNFVINMVTESDFRQQLFHSIQIVFGQKIKIEVSLHKDNMKTKFNDDYLESAEDIFAAEAN